MASPEKQVEAVFRLVDGSTFHAIERRWITDEGPETVKACGWFEDEMPDPWLDPPALKRVFLQGTAIVWWQEPDQVTPASTSPSKVEVPDASH
jgi:hypothetical protein